MRLFQNISKGLPFIVLISFLCFALHSNVYGQESDVDKLIIRYKTMAKSKPENPSVNYRLGTLYYSIKDYELSIKHLEIAVNNSENDYQIMDMLGWAYYKAKKLDASKAIFEKILVAKPGNASATKAIKLIKGE